MGLVFIVQSLDLGDQLLLPLLVLIHHALHVLQVSFFLSCDSLVLLLDLGNEVILLFFEEQSVAVL